MIGIKVAKVATDVAKVAADVAMQVGRGAGGGEGGSVVGMKANLKTLYDLCGMGLMPKKIASQIIAAYRQEADKATEK